MSDRYVQVEGHPDLVRDTHSHAIINRNRSAYKQAKKRAEEAQMARDEIRTATREINNISKEVGRVNYCLKNG